MARGGGRGGFGGGAGGGRLRAPLPGQFEVDVELQDAAEQAMQDETEDDFSKELFPVRLSNHLNYQISIYKIDTN